MEIANCPVENCSGYIDAAGVFTNTVGQKPAAKRDCPECGTALVWWKDRGGWEIDQGEEQRRRHARGEG